MRMPVILLMSLFLTACINPRDFIPKPKPPAPNPPASDRDFYAFGSHWRLRTAEAVAVENAENFCKKWHLQPATYKKQSAFYGVLSKETRKEIDDDPRLTSWTPSRTRWEIRLVYNCL